MSNRVRKLRALWDLALTKGPENQVSKRWLFRTGSGLDRRFRASQNISISNAGEFLRVAFGNEIFLWPANSSTAGMLQILSELFNPSHPHQYLYGPTKVRPDDVVLDIGACEGSFAAVVTGHCERVIAVEPSRTMCRVIKELFNVRQQPCPLIVECLLGGSPSTAYFVENVLNPGQSRITFEPAEGAYRVPVFTLDQLVEMVDDKPTFIKCDAEGAALEIFSGGRNFLQACRPRLAIASYHSDSEFPLLYQFLKALGYNITGKGFLFSGSKLRVQMIHAW